MSVGRSEKRVDAFDKVTGRAKYVDDLCNANALIVKIYHSTIAHGYVTGVDTSEAEQVPGVVKILTCFDVPDVPFPTAGHPWSTDPGPQDVADRLLLNRHVRYYGDDVACVIAENEVLAPTANCAASAESSAKMRSTSSFSFNRSTRISLLISTIGIGSTNKVAPEPEVSCTRPGS